jgi:hypothetical protein
MSDTVWKVSRVAHAVIIRGCCGNTDAICNCQPTECECTPPEGEPNHG